MIKLPGMNALPIIIGLLVIHSSPFPPFQYKIHYYSGNIDNSPFPSSQSFTAFHYLGRDASGLNYLSKTTDYFP